MSQNGNLPNDPQIFIEILRALDIEENYLPVIEDNRAKIRKMMAELESFWMGLGMGSLFEMSLRENIPDHGWPETR